MRPPALPAARTIIAADTATTAAARSASTTTDATADTARTIIAADVTTDATTTATSVTATASPADTAWRFHGHDHHPFGCEGVTTITHLGAADTARTAGLGKGCTKCRRKVLRDDIQGITKPAIRRLARRGGVKRISGLIYEETRGVLNILPAHCTSTATECTARSMTRLRSLPGTPPTGTAVVAIFSHRHGTAALESPACVEGLAGVLARMHLVKEMALAPAPGNLRTYHANGVCEGPTHGDGVAVLFLMNNIHAFSEKARSSNSSLVGNGAPMPEMSILRWLRLFNLGKEVRGTLIYLYTYMFTYSPCLHACVLPNAGVHLAVGGLQADIRLAVFSRFARIEMPPVVASKRWTKNR
jgi:histone H4